MLLAIEDLQFVNASSGFTPTPPVGNNTAKLPDLQNFSTFGSSVTTLSGSLPVVVFSDFSCWVPLLQSFVAPEKTNLSSKLNQGCGS